MGFLHARHRSEEKWEDHCNRCGLCCYERQEMAGGVRVILSRPCPHLDTQNHTCRVYDRRFAVAALCRKVNIFHALFGRRMPLDCGYVQRYRVWDRDRAS